MSGMNEHQKGIHTESRSVLAHPGAGALVLTVAAVRADGPGQGET